MQTKHLSLLILGFALLIALAGCGSSDADVSESMSPEQVVQAFYDWYVAYPGNPLVDGAYRSSEFLTASFVQKVDEIIGSFERGGYDPFLCAQDIPQSFTLDPAVLSSDGSAASLVVHTSFEGHSFTVQLEARDGRWAISDVICPAAGEGSAPAAATTPQEVVRSFYDWYLTAINAGRATGEMRSPLADGSYASAGYLTDELVQKIEATLASFDGAGYDPILCAQDVPESFTIPSASTSSEKTTVEVHTSFPGHSFQVEIVQVEGDWKINNIRCALGDEDGASGAVAEPILEPESMDVDPSAGWQLFREETYGFQLQYPPDWTFVEIELRDPELDKPLVRLLHFLPQAWAEGLNQGGPPDPNQPPVIAPLAVEVSVGDMQAYRRLYVEPTHAESVQLGDNTALLEEYTSGDVREIRYLFQDPEDDELRVTLRDQISGFPDRAQDNQEIIEATNLILTTFQFIP